MLPLRKVAQEENRTRVSLPDGTETTYSFTYGDFSLRSGVYIGERILAQYTYSERNNFLERLDYGNGDRVQYEYDKQGRVTSQTYEDGDTVTYRYDNNGALASVTDSDTGRTTTYYYDFTNRLMKYVESGDVDHSVRYTYDDQNKLTDLVEVINGVTQTTHYTYDDDQRISSIQNGDKVISYTYDEYGRVSQKTDGIFTYTYTYKSTDTGAPSNQIDTVSVMLNGTACTTFQYTYDDNGNILSVSDALGLNTYIYDSAGQLIRENNWRANRTWVWTYDDAGNILSRSEYGYNPGTVHIPIDTIVYTYGDESWGDLLTAYDGVTITYDAMGNPLNDGTWTYTWEHGRQLASMTDGDTTWTYTYDANGMRSKRTNGTDTYTYIYNGSKLMQMTVGTNTLTFTYDGSGNPSTVTLNGTTYYYITNLQGDVIEIRTSSGTKVCDYNYDAWGKVVSVQRYSSDPIAILNPLLYRGYVYDRDTGLYYLQSRYYDPNIGRFLNADALVSTGQGVLGNNMFAYCLNNPVNYSDEDGDRSDSIWGWIGEEIGELIYEWITGEDHPNDQAEALETEIISTQNEMIAGAAKAVWDAYMWSYNQQQEAQMQQALASRDFILDRFSTPQKTANTFLACACICDAGAELTKACPKVSVMLKAAKWIFTGLNLIATFASEE